MHRLELLSALNEAIKAGNVCVVQVSFRSQTKAQACILWMVNSFLFLFVSACLAEILHQMLQTNTFSVSEYNSMSMRESYGVCSLKQTLRAFMFISKASYQVFIEPFTA